MTEQNPFSEGDDSERTVIRPAPGGRRAVRPQGPPLAVPPAPAASVSPPSPPPPAPPPPPAARQGRPEVPTPPPARPPAAPAQPARPPGLAAVAPAGDSTELVGFGDSPLTDAASPLLQLLARLRNTANAPDAGNLRERVVQELRAFETRARAADVPAELLRSANYALCASIDDVVVNTPWGSAWAAEPLVALFHRELGGKERFFDVLARVRANPDKFLPLIELMYLCLSLGYMGSYRAAPRGTAEIDRIRAETYPVIAAARAAIAPGLSPHAKGVDAPYRPARARLPVWVAGAAGLAALGGMFLWVTTDLADASDGVYERMLGARPDKMPLIARAAPVVAPPPPPPADEPTFLDKLRLALKPDIDKGLVTVGGTATTPMVRVHNRNMFPAGSARLQPGFAPLIERIAAALGHESGHVTVAGYTDNQPIHTVQFPSNFQLSAARAKAVLDILAHTLPDPARAVAEGRADADPVAPNATAEGREQNRRIEIILRRES